MQQTSMICNNFGGINRSSAKFSSGIITASDSQNVELFSTGVNSGTGIRTAKGNVAVCSSIPATEKIINIYESVQKGKSYCFVYTESETKGRIYLYSTDTKMLTLKVDNLSVTSKSCATDASYGWADIWIFSNSEEMLSICVGNYNGDGELDEVKMLNPKDRDGRCVKGLGLVIFSGRLWVFDGQVLWYSVQEDVYDFSTSDAEVSTSAGYIEFVKNITAIYPYLGTLAVFHSNSSCLISVSETDGSFSKTLDSPGGCASYNALVFHGTELYFYDDTKKGVFCFREVVNGNKTLGNNIAVDIQEELIDIPKASLSQIRALSVVTSDRNEVWFLLPTNQESYSQILIYDYLRASWVKRKSQKINCFAMINGTLMSAGKKLYEEYVSATFDGEFIPAYYDCSPLNLGCENTLKILSFAPRVCLDLYYNNRFYVEYTKNYDAKRTKKRLINMRSNHDVLYFDIGHWDKSRFPHKDLNAIKKLPSSYFKTLQIKFITKEEGEDFCIKNIEFGKIKMKLV